MSDGPYWKRQGTWYCLEKEKGASQGFSLHSTASPPSPHSSETPKRSQPAKLWFLVVSLQHIGTKPSQEPLPPEASPPARLTAPQEGSPVFVADLGGGTWLLPWAPADTSASPEKDP